MVIVVAPLRSLIRDQVRRWNERKVRAFSIISEDISDEDMTGLYLN